MQDCPEPDVRVFEVVVADGESPTDEDGKLSRTEPRSRVRRERQKILMRLQNRLTSENLRRASTNPGPDFRIARTHPEMYSVHRRHPREIRRASEEDSPISYKPLVT